MDNMEFIQKYMNKMKHIQEIILEFIENDEYQENDYQKLIYELDKLDIRQNKHDLKAFLHLVSQISLNHFRNPDFFTKIGRIIKSFQIDINKYFSNFSIFNIFKKDKRLLLFLLKEKIIIPEKSIFLLISSKKYKERFYTQFFYPEFKYYFDSKLIEEVDPEISQINPLVFKENRENAENDSYLCRLIQKDSIEEFVTYITQTNLSLSSTKVPKSIFETNSFLLKQEETSLIEYAAFFGSIQIFQYLRINKVELSPSLWQYAIHSNNAELIHILEDNHVKPLDSTYIDCYLESVKCHHIDFMNYILENYYKIEENQKILGFPLFYNFVSTSDEYYSIDQKSFYDFCKYDHYSIVYFIIKNKLVDLKSKNEIFNFDVFESSFLIFINDVL